VTIDGQSAGTGWYNREVSAGVHEVLLVTAGGLRHEARVTVPAGGTLSFCWDFELDTPCR
jgi:hypothetical protein